MERSMRRCSHASSELMVEVCAMAQIERCTSSAKDGKHRDGLLVLFISLAVDSLLAFSVRSTH